MCFFHEHGLGKVNTWGERRGRSINFTQIKFIIIRNGLHVHLFHGFVEQVDECKSDDGNNDQILLQAHKTNNTAIDP